MCPTMSECAPVFHARYPLEMQPVGTTLNIQVCQNDLCRELPWQLLQIGLNGGLAEEPETMPAYLWTLVSFPEMGGLELQVDWGLNGAPWGNGDLYRVIVTTPDGSTLLDETTKVNYVLDSSSCGVCYSAVEVAQQVCVGSVEMGTDAGAMTTPTAAACYDVCTSDADCGMGETCTNFGSQSGCVATSNGPCQSDADCAPGLVCYGLDPDATPEENAARMTACLAPPTPCMSDSDCPEAFQCNSTTATCEAVPQMGASMCMTDADCAMGELCDAATATCVVAD
jgi:Dickkopf N-terminal cysteine-rich region